MLEHQIKQETALFTSAEMSEVLLLENLVRVAQNSSSNQIHSRRKIMSNDEAFKIRSVTLKNFRTFYGEKQPIELSIDPKKPVTVIHGKNGKG